MVFMGTLRAELMRRVPSPQGPQSDVLLVESSGEEHQVRCLCKEDGTTEISVLDGPERLIVLEERYGEQVIWALCRQITLSSYG